MRRALAAAAAVFVALTLAATPTFAHESGGSSSRTHWVNDDDPNGGLYVPPGRNCKDPGYAKIQQAVDASAPGDTILVCPGTYTEQVKIDPAHSRITLRSTEVWAAIIKAPPVLAMTEAVVHVNGARDVGILGFTITGNGTASCGPPGVAAGVLVNYKGSALIAGNHVTGIGDATQPLGGCQDGIGIQIGSYTLSGGMSTPGTAAILYNLIDRYQKGGIVVNEPGSYGLVDSNRVKGVGATTRIAQNGIQIGYYAHADVQNNAVSDNIYTDPTGPADLYDSSGILLTDLADDGVRIRNNRVYQNDNGIWLTGSEITDVANGYGPTQNIRVEKNEIWSNVHSGLFADEFTLQNRIKNNRSLNNGSPANGDYDCRDEAPPSPAQNTFNYWIDNIGKTENKEILCSEDKHSDGHHDGHGGDNSRTARSLGGDVSWTR
jgi:parallel beta-helix repeat protein